MPLTVLQVLPELESGGVERGTLEVAAELVRRGHRSLVLSGGGRMVAQLEQQGSTHITAPVGSKNPLTLLQVARLRRIIREERIDILHARSRVPAWVAWMAWKSLPERERPRFITTVHGAYSVSRYSAIMTKGEAVIAVSRTIRDYVSSRYPQTPAERIHLIPRGVDPEEFPYGYQPSNEWRESFLTQFPQCRDRRLITLPGRITRLKGHEALLRLIPSLKAQGLAVQALIVGGEDPRRKHYADELRQMIQSMQLSADVTLTGHRSDMKEIYALSDVVLSLSSKPESFGRTVLEALQLGTPVAGFDHGGVGEILSDVFPEGRVPFEDEAELQKTVTSLLVNQTRVPPTSHYRLADMLNATASLYETMATERAARSAA